MIYSKTWTPQNIPLTEGHGQQKGRKNNLKSKLRRADRMRKKKCLRLSAREKRADIYVRRRIRELLEQSLIDQAKVSGATKNKESGTIEGEEKVGALAKLYPRMPILRERGFSLNSIRVSSSHCHVESRGASRHESTYDSDSATKGIQCDSHSIR